MSCVKGQAFTYLCFTGVTSPVFLVSPPLPVERGRGTPAVSKISVVDLNEKRNSLLLSTSTHDWQWFCVQCQYLAQLSEAKRRNFREILTSSIFKVFIRKTVTRGALNISPAYSPFSSKNNDLLFHLRRIAYRKGREGSQTSVNLGRYTEGERSTCSLVIEECLRASVGISHPICTKYANYDQC